MTERDRFEYAWREEYPLHESTIFRRSGLNPDAYVNTRVQDGWLMWQSCSAAHSAGAQEPVAEIVRWLDFTNKPRFDIKVIDKTLEHGAKLYSQPMTQTDSAGAQEPVAIHDGWMLVKRERIEEIRQYARTEFVNSYLGRNLYDEHSLMKNERIGEEALSNIRDVLSWIEEDEKDRIAAHPQPMPQTDAARDVLAERQRQVNVEGWTTKHDDLHTDFGAAKAAAVYALHAADTVGVYSHFWPWEPHWWKPSTPRRNLVKAGALILAEIERIDRAKGE